MKSLIIFVSFIFLSPIILWSQSVIEIRYGLNRAIWRLDDRILEDFTYTLDRQVASIGINIPIHKMFSLHPEIGYVQKGNKLILRDTAGSYTYTDKLNFIELPILLKFNFKYEQFTFYISAGPNIAYALNGKSIYLEQTSTVSFTQEDKILFSNKEFKKTDFGLLLGTGASVPIWKLRLGVDIRYSYALTGVLDERSIYPFKAFSKGIQLCGLIGIPLSWD
jgi:hypothetical protein